MDDQAANIKFINTGISKLTGKDNDTVQNKFTISRKRKKNSSSKSYYKPNYLSSNSDLIISPLKPCKHKLQNKKRLNKALKKSGLYDFQELKAMIDQIQEQYNMKVIQNSKKSNKTSNINSSLSTITTINSSKLEQSILGFIARSRDCFPKLYTKLTKIGQGVASQLTEEYYNPILGDTQYEKIATFESSKLLVRKFITRIHKNIMKGSSELAEDVLIKTLQSLEKDYEMEFEDEQFPSYLQDNNPLAITDVGMEYENTKYIDTNSNGSVEELTNFSSH